MRKDKDVIAELEAELDEIRPIAAAAVALRHFWAVAGGGHSSPAEQTLIRTIDEQLTGGSANDIRSHAERLRVRASKPTKGEPA